MIGYIAVSVLLAAIGLAWLYVAVDALVPNFPTRIARWWKGQPPA